LAFLGSVGRLGQKIIEEQEFVVLGDKIKQEIREKNRRISTLKYSQTK